MTEGRKVVWIKIHRHPGTSRAEVHRSDRGPGVGRDRWTMGSLTGTKGDRPSKTIDRGAVWSMRVPWEVRFGIDLRCSQDYVKTRKIFLLEVVLSSSLRSFFYVLRLWSPSHQLTIRLHFTLRRESHFQWLFYLAPRVFHLFDLDSEDINSGSSPVSPGLVNMGPRVFFVYIQDTPPFVEVKSWGLKGVSSSFLLWCYVLMVCVFLCSVIFCSVQMLHS